MAKCRARTCVSWRLAGETVAGENRLVKFLERDSCKSHMELHEKTRLLCRKFAARS